MARSTTHTHTHAHTHSEEPYPYDQYRRVMSNDHSRNEGHSKLRLAHKKRFDRASPYVICLYGYVHGALEVILYLHVGLNLAASIQLGCDGCDSDSKIRLRGCLSRVLCFVNIMVGRKDKKGLLFKLACQDRWTVFLVFVL
jgi:hypothetical protein